VIVWLNESGSTHRTERMELVNSIHEVSGIEHWFLPSRKRFAHLHVLLRLTNSFRSTDPRDKVFALLGLSSAIRDPDNWPRELVPDYTRPLQDVYAAAAKYCIRQSNSLDVLSQFVHNGTQGASPSHLLFPSWVPRWDLADSTRRISAFELYWVPHETRNLIERFNKASKGTEAITDYDTPLSILRALGIQVDTVSICLPTVTPDDTKFHAGVPERYGDYLSNIIPQLYRTCENHVTHISDSFDRTFFLVTTAGLTPEHGTARHESLDAFKSIVKSSQEPAMPHQLLLEDNRGPLQYAIKPYDFQPYAALRGRYPNRYIASLQRLMNRRLFVTSSGHLGLGPASMMSGDTVVILFGGNVPYILRSLENNRWHFTGECYLDGYMYGEALENEGRDLSRHEWFEMV